jgi:hypothetical protein
VFFAEVTQAAIKPPPSRALVSPSPPPCHRQRQVIGTTQAVEKYDGGRASLAPSNKVEVARQVRSQPLVLVQVLIADTYVISRGDVMVVKERGMVRLALGGSDDGIVSHHSSCSLSCVVSSRRRREGGRTREKAAAMDPPSSMLTHVEEALARWKHAELVEDISSCHHLCKVDA